MDCGATRNWLLQAERPDSPPAAVADHVRDCAACAAFAARVERLDGALRNEPLPDAAIASRDAFVTRLAATPVQPMVRSRGSRNWAVAALMLLAFGLASLLVLPGTPVQASPNVVDRLIDWNVNLASGERSDAARRFAAAEPTLSADLAELSASERELADTLLVNGRWLATNDDPVEAAVRMHDVADRLFDRLRKAAARGDARASQQFARRLRNVAGGFDRFSAGANLTPEQQKRIDQIERRRAKRQQALAELHAKMPTASKRELRLALEASRKKPKAKSRPNP